MKILFLHGWNSVPGGVKPSYLSQQGAEVLNPKLDDNDFEAALKQAQELFDLHQPNVIVGSSRGGSLALNLTAGETPRVLLCPAWKKWGQQRTLTPNTCILHSRLDEVIPFEDSEELLLRSHAPEDRLIEVGIDHRLADEASLAAMWWTCKLLLDRDSELGWQEIIANPEHSTDEASYLCDSCGEEIVIPLDPTAGSHQQYVEDCPVCCHPNVIRVEYEAVGTPRVWAESEQDHE